MSSDAVPDEKSAEKSAPGVPFVAGDPRAGRGPAPGAPNAGRPTNEFSEACKGLQRGVILDKCKEVIADKAKGPKDADWQWAVKWVSKFGESETAKRHEHTGADGAPILLEHVLRERAEQRRDSSE
jgi:hypothetical protein